MIYERSVSDVLTATHGSVPVQVHVNDHGGVNDHVNVNVGRWRIS